MPSTPEILPAPRGDDDAITMRRRRRVLNYDLERWVTELRPRLQPHQQTLTLDVHDEPMPAVLCDREKIGEVVVNLLVTAHTFAGARGKITLRARQAGAFVRIEVESTRGRVEAADSKPSDASRRIGASRRIVELHGGSMTEDENPDRATTFAFTIPLAPQCGSASPAVSL